MTFADRSAVDDGAARLDRERAFHDRRFAEGDGRRQDKYYSAIRHGKQAYDAAVDALAPGRRLLEVGCASGGRVRGLAPVAAASMGIDLSAVAIERARAQVDPPLRERTTFLAGDACATGLPDAALDVVYGAGIVHHLPVEDFLGEVRRLLVPGGRAIFWEPLGHNPLINAYRRLTPSARTPDEHPLTMADLASARRIFGAMECRFYGLTTLAAAPLPQGRARRAALAGLRVVDRGLLALPGVRRIAWYALIDLERRP